MSHVLLIDLSIPFCGAFASMLRTRGYQVDSAAGLEQGLQLAREHRPSVVCLDFRTCSPRAADSVAAFREASPQAVVVMLSVSDDPSYARSAQSIGADAWQSKGGDFLPLLDRLCGAVAPLTNPSALPN